MKHIGQILVQQVKKDDKYLSKFKDNGYSYKLGEQIFLNESEYMQNMLNVKEKRAELDEYLMKKMDREKRGKRIRKVC